MIDDLQWCDSSSLRFVAYLVAQARGNAAAARRDGAHDRSGDRPGAARRDHVRPATVEVRPGPLTGDRGSPRCSTGPARPAIGAEIATNAYVATGGNPLMLRELMGAIESNATDPAAGAGGLVGEVGAQSVARTVNFRMARLARGARSRRARRLVLGESSSLRTIAAFTELSEAEVAAAIADLVGARFCSTRCRRLRPPADPRRGLSRRPPRRARASASSRPPACSASSGSARPRRSQLLHAPVAADDWVAGAAAPRGHRGLQRAVPRRARCRICGARSRKAHPGIDRGRDCCWSSASPRR